MKDMFYKICNYIGIICTFYCLSKLTFEILPSLIGPIYWISLLWCGYVSYKISKKKGIL